MLGGVGGGSKDFSQFYSTVLTLQAVNQSFFQENSLLIINTDSLKENMELIWRDYLDPANKLYFLH